MLQTRIYDATGEIEEALTSWGRIATNRGPGRSGTCAGGGASSIQLDAGASTRDRAYKGLFIELLDSDDTYIESNVVTSYGGATKVATVETPWGTVPVSGVHKFRIFRARKFFVESIGDDAEDVIARIAQLDASPGYTRLRIGADTVTVVRPYAVTAEVGDPGDGGVFDATGVYDYRITAVTDLGETNGSRVISATVDDTTKRVTLGWEKPGAGLKYNVYRRTGTDPFERIAEELDDVDEYIDDGSPDDDTEIPDANTTAGVGSPHYGVPPALGTADLVIGELPHGKAFVYWVGPDETPFSTAETTQAMRGQIVFEEAE